MRSIVRIAGVFCMLLFGIMGALLLLVGVIIALVQMKMAAAVPMLLIVFLLYGWLLYAFFKYRQSRQEEFLHFLAVTVETQAPLAPALDAYVRDRPQGPLREFFVMGMLLIAMPGYYWIWHQRHSFDHKISQLAELLRAGYELPEALRAVPGLVSREAILLTELGETTDQLSRCLHHSMHQRYAAIWLEMVPRLIYPLALLFFMNGILGFWMVFIRPKMQRIFQEFDSTLPVLTQQMFDFWDAVSDHGWVIAVLFKAGLVLVSVLVVSSTARWYCPVIGRLYRRHVQGQVLRLLGLLLEAGKTVPEALNLLAEAGYFAGVVRKRLRGVQQRIEQGEPLAASLRNRGLLPAAVAPVIQAAEGIRNLPWALLEIGDHLANRTVRALQRFSLLLSPISVLAIGTMVGLSVIAMFLPLVELLTRMTE